MKKKIFLLIVFMFLSWVNLIVNYTDTKVTKMKEIDKLFEKVSERLSLMKDVALYKYINKQEIYAPNVEEKIILSAGIEANKYKLPEKSTQDFIRLQMNIAASIQENWFDYWNKNGLKNPEIQDINLIRIKLANLTKTIITQIAKSKNEISETNKKILFSEINKLILIQFVSCKQKTDTLKSIIKIINESKEGR
jgi:chorismate mutase-like protein